MGRGSILNIQDIRHLIGTPISNAIAICLFPQPQEGTNAGNCATGLQQCGKLPAMHRSCLSPINQHPKCPNLPNLLSIQNSYDMLLEGGVEETF